VQFGLKPVYDASGDRGRLDGNERLPIFPAGARGRD
jgi:hypothetical protein